jgi:uncharacterized protein (TIGR04255 family)
VNEKLVDWLRIESPAREVYERPPLVLALCQVRFSTIFGLDDSRVAPFQQEIESRYPNPNKQQQMTVPFGASINQLAAPSSSAHWQFSDDSGDWTVTLTNEFVSLETRAYKKFEDFLERLDWVLQVLVSTVNPSSVRRIGLRYINEVRSESQNWSGIVRQELLGALSIDAFRENCEQAIQLSVFRLGDAKVTFNYGVFQTGTTVVPKPETPQPHDPFYLMDIDVYQEFNPPNLLKMKPPDVGRIVGSYHESIGRLFRWATTDSYRASLGVRQDDR